MTTFVWILLGGILMSAIALVGSVTLVLREATLQKILLGGLSIAGVFVQDVRLGIAAWLAAAAHEVPQELGDFGVLIHAGWTKRTALLFNLISGLTFLVDGMVAYVASLELDWCGPALMAWKRCPKRAESTTSTEPDGPLGDSLGSAVTWSTRESGKNASLAHATPK